MSEVRILSPDSFGCQLCNLKSEDSIADCHDKRTGEDVAEKMAEDNLDPVVVKLKGERKLKDTVNILLKSGTEFSIKFFKLLKNAICFPYA